MIASETKEIIRNATWHRRELTQWIECFFYRTQAFSNLSHEDRGELQTLRAACHSYNCELDFWRDDFLNRACRNVPRPSTGYTAEFRALRKSVREYLDRFPSLLTGQESHRGLATGCQQSKGKFKGLREVLCKFLYASPYPFVGEWADMRFDQAPKGEFRESEPGYTHTRQRYVPFPRRYTPRTKRYTLNWERYTPFRRRYKSV